MTTLTKDSKMLSNALLANALFSGLSGLVFALDAGFLADFTGINSPFAFVMIGIGLLGFAAYLWQLRKSAPDYNASIVWGVIAADLLWVAGSAALLLSDALPLTVAGKWAVGMIADVVLGFAVWQYFGLRRAQG